MAEKGQNRERHREIFLRFQSERLAALGRKIAARKVNPGLSWTKTNLNRDTTTGSEKGWYYLCGFLNGIKFTKAVAKHSPERLPIFLGMKGGAR